MKVAEASILDLHLSISEGFVKTKIYNKRDDFDFPFLDGDVPRSTSYGVYISLVIGFNSKPSHTRYRYHKICKALLKFYRWHFDIVSKYSVVLKTLLLQGLPEPKFYGDLVYRFRKVIDKHDLPYHFKMFVTKKLVIT